MMLMMLGQMLIMLVRRHCDADDVRADDARTRAG